MKDIRYFLNTFTSISYYSSDCALPELPNTARMNSQVIIHKDSNSGKFDLEKCRFYYEFQSLTRKELKYFLTSMEPEISKHHIERERKMVA